jgi:hypothetical protein
LSQGGQTICIGFGFHCRLLSLISILKDDYSVFNGIAQSSDDELSALHSQ